VIVGTGVFEAKRDPILIFLPDREKIKNAAPRMIRRAVPTNRKIVLLDWFWRFL